MAIASKPNGNMFLSQVETVAKTLIDEIQVVKNHIRDDSGISELDKYQTKREIRLVFSLKHEILALENGMTKKVMVC
jgi:hypothetical protein